MASQQTRSTEAVCQRLLLEARAMFVLVFDNQGELLVGVRKDGPDPSALLEDAVAIGWRLARTFLKRPMSPCFDSELGVGCTHRVGDSAVLVLFLGWPSAGCVTTEWMSLIQAARDIEPDFKTIHPTAPIRVHRTNLADYPDKSGRIDELQWEMWLSRRGPGDGGSGGQGGSPAEARVFLPRAPKNRPN